jgi:hypothetical protein
MAMTATRARGTSTDSVEVPTPVDAAEMRSERAARATEAAIEEIIARAPELTAEQRARLGRMFTYIDPPAAAPAG